MTFTPVDAAMLFVFAFIFVGAGAYAGMRLRFDLVSWAILAGGSLPPVVYFTVRVDNSLRAIVLAVFAVVAGWALLMAVIRVQSELDDLVDSVRPPRWPAQPFGASKRPQRWLAQPIAAARLPEGGRIPTGARHPIASPAAHFLLVFGGAILTTAAFALIMLFTPGRHGPAFIAFRPDNPVFELCGAGGLVGLALLAASRWYSRRAKRRSSPY